MIVGQPDVNEVRELHSRVRFEPVHRHFFPIRIQNHPIPPREAGSKMFFHGIGNISSLRTRYEFTKIFERDLVIQQIIKEKKPLGVTDPGIGLRIPRKSATQSS